MSIWDDWAKTRGIESPIGYMHRVHGLQTGMCKGCRFLKIKRNRSSFCNGYWEYFYCQQYPCEFRLKPDWKSDYHSCGLKEAKR